jgi:GTP-binding protein
MMEITKAEFIVSALNPGQYPGEMFPAAAMVGRSNVGKSSCINALTRRKSLARTSSEPGKTRYINFYRINDAFYLVDLPGYGYARTSKAEQRAWGPMMERFFSEYPALRCLIQLVDARHSPTAQDREAFRWLMGFDIPLLVVATKVDKLGKSQVPPRLKAIRSALQCPDTVPVLPFSAPNRQGVEEILSFLESALA